MKKLLLSGLLLTTMIGNAQTGDPSKYAAKITVAGLKEKLTIIASPEMEGRETASPGQKKRLLILRANSKNLD